MWTACVGPDSARQPASGQPTPSVTTTVHLDEITLSGRVTGAYGPHIFAVGSGPERVIVVIATPTAFSVGSDVDVTGHVRTFRRQELEAELGVDLGPAATSMEDGSCLVASVARLR